MWRLLFPQNMPEHFSWILPNSAVSVSGLKSMRYININTSNAPIDLEHVASDQVIAYTSNGAVTLDEVSVSGTVDMKSSNGALTARQAAARDKLSMTTSNGRISILKL